MPLADDVLTIAENSGNVDLGLKFYDRLMELFRLWSDRQRKYGPKNIAAFGELGCLVRGHDKMARLRNALIENKGADSVDETIEDAWNDLANYSIMAVMCRRGEWPE